MRTETYEDGVLVNVTDDGQPEPEAPPAADVVAVIEAMTPAQLDAMRQLLGL